MGGSGLDRTGDFQQFCGSGLDRIQFYPIRTGLGLKNFTVRSSLFWGTNKFTFRKHCKIAIGIKACNFYFCFRFM